MLCEQWPCWIFEAIVVGIFGAIVYALLALIWRAVVDGSIENDSD
jgi:hypothetical protein